MEQHLMPKVGELAHIMEGFVIGMILSMSPIENINEMTNQLFNVTPLKSRSLMQRVFKQLPKENAVIDLNNLLANQPIQNITVQQIQEIQIRYSVNLQREYELNLKEFYAVYFNYCLKDKHLSDAEIQDLNHLKKLFSLSDKTVQELQHKIGEEVYNEAYQGAIADGRLTEQEQAFLSKLENQLLLPRDLVEKIEIEAKKGFLNRYVADAIKDDRISPQEEEELQAIAESLNINIEMDASSKEVFNKFKYFWALENLDLPTIEADVKLFKNEMCHLHVSNVHWFELRSDRSSNYSTNLHGKKYLTDLPSSPQHGKEYRLIDEGDLYLTDKRIIFIGIAKTTNIRFEKILTVVAYPRSIEVIKDSGRNPVLCFGDARAFNILYERLSK